MTSILTLRQKRLYRFLEGALAVCSFSFLLLAILLAWAFPTGFAVSLVIYSLLWLFRSSLNVFYTIFAFKQNTRWQTFDFELFFQDQQLNLASVSKNLDLQSDLEAKSTWQLAKRQEALQSLASFEQKYQGQIGWSQKIQQDLQVLQAGLDTDSKFWPSQVFHLPVFAIYNEPSEVLIRSLQKIWANNYDLSKIVVVVSQEARVGDDFNELIRQEIASLPWLEAHLVQKVPEKLPSDHNSQLEVNIETLPNQKKNSNSNLEITNLSSPSADLGSESVEVRETTKNEKEDRSGQNLEIAAKLQVYFCQHPDGLVGEIKGKASNEDWGARIGAQILADQQVDPELVLVTSLDADSYLQPNFFRHLSYRFCASSNRHQSAFQPVHNYNHNFFEIGFWPRLVATQTTFYNLTNLALEDQMTTFAIYSVPLTVLQEVDFWVREVIAEDSLIFLKSLVHFRGHFGVIPHFGQMEADSVQHHDYFEEINSQYKQLQRWAWGGVEGFPYLFWQFFKTKAGRQIDLRIRLKWLYLLFSNHFFWATTPLIFGLGPFLPNFIHGNNFMATATSQNLSLFSQYFAWISYIFTFVFGYLTIVFIALRDNFSLGKTVPTNSNLEMPINANSESVSTSSLPAQTKKTLTGAQIWAITIQIIISPFVYFLMAIPALDAQLRGLWGNYLGYWVTPKK